MFRLDLDAKMDMGVRTLCIGVGSVKLFKKNKPGQKFPFDPSHDPLLLNVTLVPLNLQMN